MAELLLRRDSEEGAEDLPSLAELAHDSASVDVDARPVLDIVLMQRERMALFDSPVRSPSTTAGCSCLHHGGMATDH